VLKAHLRGAPMSEERRPSAGTLRFQLGPFPVAVLPSFWLISFLVARSGGDGGPFIAEWIVVAFVSVLVHELGHALAARAFGGDAYIELHGMGGTTYPSAHAPLRPWQDITVSLAGPVAGLALGAVAYAVRVGLGARLEGHPVWQAAIADILWTSWGYGLLNFLPILPLDGGPAMHSLIEWLRGRPAAHLVAAISLAAAPSLLALSPWARPARPVPAGRPA